MTPRNPTTWAQALLLALALPACGGEDPADAAAETDAAAEAEADASAAAPDATPADLGAGGGSGGEPGSPDDTSRAARAPTCPTRLATCVATAPALDTSVACSGVRWIGLLRQPGAPCPSPARIDAGTGTWSASRLFTDANLPPSMDAYCVYTWTPPAAQPDQQPPQGARYLAAFGAAISPAGSATFASVARDCHAVGVQDTAVTQPVGALAESAYYTAVGQVAPLPDGAVSGPAAIRVAVADSTPHGYVAGLAQDGRSDHGLNVGRIVRKIACPGDGGGVNCVGYVSNHLALPQVSPVVATPLQGGFYGYQTQLAASILTAVSDWQSHNAAPPAGEARHERLVINLSVGWDPTYGGAFANNAWETLTPPTRAVYHAIRHAACRGALVVAAAGNDPGGPSPAVGPMFPGAWEAKPAPTAAQCATLEGPGFAEDPDHPVFPLPGGTPYRPILYGVAGVGHTDYPLANARKGSSGRLVALGQMAATRYEESPGTWIKTLAISGSSAAAAAVSGAAATLWGYRPELRPYELVDLLYNNAVSLDPDPAMTARRAQVCLTGVTCSGLPVRRLDVCAALRAACASGAPGCYAAADAPVCTPAPRYALTGLDLSPAEPDYAATAPAVFDATPLTAKLQGLSVCGHQSAKVFFRTAALAGAYPVDPCPLRQYYNEGAQPWVGPQPTTPICAECKLGSGVLTAAVYPIGSKQLNVLIDSKYGSSTITNGVLEFLGASGSVMQSGYLKDLGLPATMTAGYSYQVNNVTVNARPASARLSFTVTDRSGGAPYSRQAVVTLY